MEKTGCKIICGAPTTLAFKGLMMMMMMRCENVKDRGQRTARVNNGKEVIKVGMAETGRRRVPQTKTKRKKVVITSYLAVCPINVSFITNGSCVWKTRSE